MLCRFDVRANSFRYIATVLADQVPTEWAKIMVSHKLTDSMFLESSI